MKTDIRTLLTEVIPDLFSRPMDIGTYGNSPAHSKSLDELSDLLEKGSASQLAQQISEIVAQLVAADPQTIARKPSALARFFGKDIEQLLLYERARRTLDEQIESTADLVTNLRMTLYKLDELEKIHQEEAERLKIYIEAGQRFLQENPSAGLSDNPALEFDKPRERFARKLANLAALLASHEMSNQQIKLAKAQAIDMLDRYHEITTTLLPVWRQHTLALITTRHMSPELVRHATQAHQALMNGLKKSLDGIR